MPADAPASRAPRPVLRRVRIPGTVGVLPLGQGRRRDGEPDAAAAAVRGAAGPARR
jgi:hypothetical protein